jgi:hypothetical protein
MNRLMLKPRAITPVLARIALALLFTVGPALAARFSATAEAQEAAPAAQNPVFIPLAVKPGGGTTPPPPPPTKPPVVAGGVFLHQNPQTVSADVAVDSRGGLHAAYAGYVGYGSVSPGYYMYCDGSAKCTNPDAWKGVMFGSAKEDYIVKVELALTAAGQPRLLLYNDYNGRIFSYAACNADCANPANWAVADITRVQWDTDLDTFEYSYHAFALDPQGRPRFIYEDHYGSIHNGLYYVFCDAGCTDSANWYEENISAGPDYDGDRVQTPALKFTSQGQPRIITQLYSVDQSLPEGVYYFSCDAGCDQKANWQRTRIFDRGNGHASWTLALDAQNRPRVAFYQGEMPGGAGYRLYYAWCNSACTSAASWAKAPVGLPQHQGEDPALVLDGQGRPRIAYTMPALEGIGYLWCDSQCESRAGQWQRRLVEPMSELNTDNPIPPPFDCSLATWSGVRPQLALGPTGNPFVGYEGERIFGGSCTAKVGWRSARFAFFPKP